MTVHSPAMKRRDFLRATATAPLLAALPSELLAQATTAPTGNWDHGAVRHLLPAVSDKQMLIKASFTSPLGAPPILLIDQHSSAGRMTDTKGEFWQFHIGGLEPSR